MSDLVERRVPVELYGYPFRRQTEPLDSEGLRWLADQLCSDERVNPDRTMASSYIVYQAAYEYPNLIDRIEKLEAALRVAQPFVEQAADENQAGAVAAMMIVEHALEAL